MTIGALAAGIGFSAGIMVIISGWELIPESIATIGIGATLATAAAGAALVWSAHVISPTRTW